MLLAHPLAWFDNPIFIKHVRSRLRRQPLAVSVAVVVVLCFCIVWAGLQDRSIGPRGAFAVLVGLQMIILGALGAAQVGNAVGTARASGILELHRISPLDPSSYALGSFFGAAIREYVLFACTMPFALGYVAFGALRPRPFVQFMMIEISLSWILHGLAILNALLGKSRSNIMGAGGLVVALITFSGTLISSLRRSDPLVDMDHKVPFYGLLVPWLGLFFLNIGVVLFFIFLAVRRKVATERIHPLSKAQALAALGALAVLSFGAIWRRHEYADFEVAVLCALVATACLLVMIVTPDRAEYEKGLRRAQKGGLPKLPWWHDLSLNRVFVAIACGLILISSTLAMGRAVETSLSSHWVRPRALPLSIAAGVLVVAYFGFAYQYFILRFGARGKMYFMLFLFLAWIVPMIAGTIVLLSGISTGSLSERASQVVLSLSPIVGLPLSALTSDRSAPIMAIQAAAITPALFFVFVFHTLLVSARRLISRSFVSAHTGSPQS